MSLKPYPAYKDSGVKWIGDIPAHWAVSALRRISTVVNGGTPTPSEKNWDGDIAWATPVDLNQFDGRNLEETFRTITEEGLRTGSSTVPGDSVLISTRAPIGYVARVSHATAFNQGCKGIVPDFGRTVARFLVYVLQSAKVDLISRGQGTTFLELGTGQLLSTVMPVPDLQEQNFIVDFLDRETAEIDAFIADQEELIALLYERRAATITQAVTKGLDPTMTMRESGVEWIGDVPVEWSVSKIGHHFDVVLGKMLDAGKIPPVDSIVLPYIRAANIQDSGLILDDVNVMPFTSAEASRFNLLAGDLLVVEGGSVGTNHVLGENFEGWSFQKTVNRVRARGSDSTKFLSYVLRTYRDAGVFSVICNGSTIMHLTAEKLRALQLAFPSFETQASIVEFLDGELADLDATLLDAQESIELSKERRAALISAAVTGKIDVRSAVAAKERLTEGELVVH